MGSHVGENMVQERLPFEPPGGFGRIATGTGALIDYREGRIEPCSIYLIPGLLGRIDRYGVHRGLRLDERCPVLAHSVLTARIAQRIASNLDPRVFGAEDREALLGVVGLYAALHDIGEIFGGDVVAFVPSEFTAPLKAYQSRCRDNVCRVLGIPLPNEAVQRLVSLADWLVLYVEACAIKSDYVHRASVWEPVALHRAKAVGLDYSVVELENISRTALTSLTGGMHMPHTDQATSEWMKVARPKLCMVSEVIDEGQSRLFYAGMASNLKSVLETPASLSHWSMTHVSSDADLFWHDLRGLRKSGQASVFPAAAARGAA